MIKNNFDDIHYPKNIDEILRKNVDEKMIDHIKRANNNYLDDISMTYLGEEMTYREFFSLVDKYAKAINSYGLQKGDTITFALPNTPETVCYFYACNTLGITAYLIDPRSSFNSMVKCIENSKSKLFVCEMGTYYSKVSKNIDKIPTDNVVVVSPVSMFNNRKNISSKSMIAKYIYDIKKVYEEMKNIGYNSNKKMFHNEFVNLGKNNNSNVDVPYEPEIPAIIVNTSGTTGNSVKGAMHSNRTYNLYTNEAQFVTNQLDRGNTYYGYIPYFSMYGSGVGMHVALNYGVIINNIPKFNGLKTMQDIIDSKANILIMTPNLSEKLVQMYINQNKDASHVKQYIIGGDNISPDKLRYENNELIKRGMKTKMVYGYGATECMPVSTTNYEEFSYVDGSVGMVYPNAYIKVLDPDTLEELEHYKEGEIYVNNPTLMMGYLNNEEENKIVLKNIDGKMYYKTGDKGYLTDTGHLFYTGRYKRMMKRPDCHQVSPIPIENAILKNDYVKDCAVVGITRKNGPQGVVPTAFVSFKDNNIENREELLTTLASDVLENLSGERENALAYVILDNIPYTNNGKVDFKKLQEKQFDDLDYYVIDDPVTRDYFAGIDNLKVIKLNNKSLSLKKK